MIRTVSQAQSQLTKKQLRNGLATGAQPTEVVGKIFKAAGIEK